MSNNKYSIYYNYLAKNWTKKLASHILKYEAVGELKYGIKSTGIDDLKKLKKSGVDIQNASIYMPAPYDLVEELLKKVNICTAKHFLDIGCGKGRAMVVAAFGGAKKISGIDFSKSLCDAAHDNFNSVKSKFKKIKVKIYHNDAFYFPIQKDVDVIFMFNPFSEIIMSGVLKNIETSLLKKSRKIITIYINPVLKKQILSYGYQETFYCKKMRYLEASILEKE